jgi:hypothetical protein
MYVPLSTVPLPHPSSPLPGPGPSSLHSKPGARPGTTRTSMQKRAGVNSLMTDFAGLPYISTLSLEGVCLPCRCRVCPVLMAWPAQCSAKRLCGPSPSWRLRYTGGECPRLVCHGPPAVLQHVRLGSSPS